LFNGYVQLLPSQEQEKTRTIMVRCEPVPKPKPKLIHVVVETIPCDFKPVNVAVETAG
jgi:hypothetical protein